MQYPLSKFFCYCITVFNLERYEDSYAIAEEFREWILHIGEKNESLRDSFLNLPKELKELLDQKVTYSF